MSRLGPLLLCCMAVHAQVTFDARACPVIAQLPADIEASAPLDKRQRFEVRQCLGENIVVTAYERAKPNASLSFDTGDGYPRILSHTQNVLVIQSLGASSDHVYVFTFQSGKPSIALKTATKDLIQVRQSPRAVVVSVPAVTYPRIDGKNPVARAPREYSFSLE